MNIPTESHRNQKNFIIHQDQPIFQMLELIINPKIN